MVRFRKCRILILNAAKIPLIEKLSLILPFIVIVIDLIVLEHAIRINEHYIILCASILFFPLRRRDICCDERDFRP